MMANRMMAMGMLLLAGCLLAGLAGAAETGESCGEAIEMTTATQNIEDVTSGSALYGWFWMDLPPWGGYIAATGAMIQGVTDTGWAPDCTPGPGQAWTDQGENLWWSPPFVPAAAGVHYIRIDMAPEYAGTCAILFYPDVTYTPTAEPTNTPEDTPTNTATNTPTDTNTATNTPTRDGAECASAYPLVEGVTLEDAATDASLLHWLYGVIDVYGARLKISGNSTIEAVTDTTWLLGGCEPAGEAAWVTESADVWVSAWYVPPETGVHYIGLSAAPDDAGEFYVELEPGYTPTPEWTATAAATSTNTALGKTPTPTRTVTLTWTSTPVKTVTPTNTTADTPRETFTPTPTATNTNTYVPGGLRISAVVEDSTPVLEACYVARAILHATGNNAALALRNGGATGLARTLIKEAVSGNSRERVFELPGLRFGTNLYADVTNGTAELHWRYADEVDKGRRR